MNNGFLRVGVGNPEIRVADPDHNAEKIIEIVKAAAKEHVEVLVFPELCLTGSTCGDLFLQKTLTDGAARALDKIAQNTEEFAGLIFAGLPVRSDGKVYNACAVLGGGAVRSVIPKTRLSESRERNERRWFTPGDGVHGQIEPSEPYHSLGKTAYDCNGVTLGVEFGSELQMPAPLSGDDCMLITVCLGAEPESAGGAQKRKLLACGQSLRLSGAYIYAGAGRGESTTDTVFSGHGIIAENGELLAENKPFGGEKLLVADIDTQSLLSERFRRRNARATCRERSEDYGGGCLDWFPITPTEFPDWQDTLRRNVSRTPFVPHTDCNETAESILTMQAEGLRTRMAHTGLTKLVLGVSGGLDSALALLVCLRALDAQELPRKNLIALSLPGFGTSEQTAHNALGLAVEAKADRRVIDIVPSVTQHLKDVGHDLSEHDAAYENAQARMRTVILMDIANREGGIAVGTGDLSEAALGWCTYNGDHMSMYGVNASVPKTLVKFLVAYEAKRLGGKMQAALEGVLATEISPELLPAKEGKIVQKTEDILGTFEQNDFFLYYAVRCGCAPQAVLLYAAAAFGGKPSDYADALAKFYKRFFASQFKRSCSPDGAAIGFSLSPRGAWRMPSDASVDLWLKSIENETKNKSSDTSVNLWLTRA